MQRAWVWAALMSCALGCTSESDEPGSAGAPGGGSGGSFTGSSGMNQGGGSSGGSAGAGDGGTSVGGGSGGRAQGGSTSTGGSASTGGSGAGSANGGAATGGSSGTSSGGTTSVDLKDGQTLVLRGNGFGTKAPAAPIVFDRFEGQPGAEVGKPTIGPDWYHESGHTSYDGTHAFSGSMAAMMDWTDDTTYGNTTLQRNLNIDEAYFSYRMYKEIYGGSSPDHWNFKHGAITSGDIDYYHGSVQYVTVELGSGDSKQSYTAQSTETPVYYAADSTASFPEDSWHRLEHYVKLSQPSGEPNGKRYFKLDGNGNFTYSGSPGGHYASPSGAVPHDVYDGDDMVTRHTDHVFQNVLLPFYLRGGYSAKVWVDEVYLDDTQARVELGDAAKWEECQDRNPQPALTWSDTQIEITLNQGRQAPGARAYAFVVLTDGRILALGEVGVWSGG